VLTIIIIIIIINTKSSYVIWTTLTSKKYSVTFITRNATVKRYVQKLGTTRNFAARRNAP